MQAPGTSYRVEFNPGLSSRLARYLWNGPRNVVPLYPARSLAHIVRPRRRVHSEQE